MNTNYTIVWLFSISFPHICNMRDNNRARTQEKTWDYATNMHIYGITAGELDLVLKNPYLAELGVLNINSLHLMAWKYHAPCNHKMKWTKSLQFNHNNTVTADALVPDGTRPSAVTKVFFIYFHHKSYPMVHCDKMKISIYCMSLFLSNHKGLHRAHKYAN